MASVKRSKSGERDCARKEFQLNSKGCCIICLKVKTSLSERDRPISRSISVLLRHLNINVAEIFTNGGAASAHMAEILPILEKSEVGVELCGECAAVTGKISEQIQILKRIRMEISQGINKIGRKISEANGDFGKVEEFRERISSDIYTLLFRDTLERFRAKLEEECDKTLDRSQLDEDESIENLPSNSNSDVVAEELTPLEDETVMKSNLPGALKSKNLTESVTGEIILDFSPTSTNATGHTTKKIRDVRTNVRKSGSRKRKCGICDKWYRSPAALACHMRWMHKKEKNVKPANDSSDDSISHKEKDTSKTSDKLKCLFPGCSKNFPCKAILNRHWTLNHPNWNEANASENPAQKTPIQDQESSSSESEDQNSIRSRRSKRTKKARVVSVSSNIAEAKKTKSEAIRIEPKLECKNCHRVFSCKLRSLFVSHKKKCYGALRNISGGKSGKKCDICSRVFRSEVALKYHQNSVHLGIRHNCEAKGCSKSFTSKAYLQMHIAQSHKLKISRKRRGNSINKPDANSQILEGFEIIITPPSTKRPCPGAQIEMFKCKFCSKIFTKKPNVKHHINEVHLQRNRVSCSFPGCPRSFSRKPNMLLHFEKVHSRKQITTTSQEELASFMFLESMASNTSL